jgi:hypothetical protein
MTQFEYIMVMVSLILALALAQALRGLCEMVTSKKRHWPHALWLATYVLFILQAWWAYWDFNVIETWTVTAYTSALIIPVIIFASIYLLVPATRAADIDWCDHFYTVRRWFFILGLLYSFMGIFVNTWYFDTPLLHPYRVFHAAFLGIWVAGIVSASERAHKALAVLMMASTILSQVVIRMQIGALMAD